MSTQPAIVRCYARDIENIDPFKGKNFGFIDSLENNGKAYLLNFGETLSSRKRTFFSSNLPVM